MKKLSKERIKDETEALYGKEPDPATFPDEASLNYSKFLSEALNYYAFAATNAQRREWFEEYVKKTETDKTILDNISYNSDGILGVATGSILARLWLRGLRGESLEENLKRYKKELCASGKEAKELFIRSQAERDWRREARHQMFVSAATTELNITLDDFIESGYKTKFVMADWIRNNRWPKEVLDKVRARFESLRDEVINEGEDEQLTEGYENLSKKERERFIEFLDDITQCSVVVRKQRKPRAKKAISTEKLIKRINFKKDHPELSISSIDPANIIGAKSLWVYNVKCRVLIHYMSDTGLSVKGTTLTNITSAEGKKLRRPEVTIPEVIGFGKLALKKLFGGLTTKFITNVKGRINKDVVLIRVVQ